LYNYREEEYVDVLLRFNRRGNLYDIGNLGTPISVIISNTSERVRTHTYVHMKKCISLQD